MLCTAGLEATQNPPRLHERHVCSQNGPLLHLGPQLCWLTELQSILVVLGLYFPGNPTGYGCTGQWFCTVLQGVARRGPTTVCQVRQGIAFYLIPAALPVMSAIGADLGTLKLCRDTMPLMLCNTTQ